MCPRNPVLLGDGNEITFVVTIPTLSAIDAFFILGYFLAAFVSADGLGFHSLEAILAKNGICLYLIIVTLPCDTITAHHESSSGVNPARRQSLSWVRFSNGETFGQCP